MVKKIIKIYLSFVLVCTLFIQIDYVNAISHSYIESVMPTRKYENITTPKNSLKVVKSNLESSYSSVNEGYVTSVKNQYSYGNCWAFATCGVAETYLIKQGIANHNIDLSEAHLNYYMYHNSGDIYNNTDNDQTLVTDSYNYTTVGADPRSIQLALDNFGLAEETSYPFANIENMNGDKVNQYHTKYILKNSKLVCSYNADQYINEIKQEIYRNGSVLASYDHQNSYYNSSYGSYYNPNEDNYLNHAITIVGWDDNYSVSHFKNQPSSDGAWLIKNSWGEGFGNNGYFWMSYEESSLGYVYSFEFMENDDISIYQYDGTANPLYSSSTIYSNIANVFEVKQEGESLKSISIATTNCHSQYQIEIYTDLKNLDDPTSGTLVIQQSSIVDHVGVNYVDLEHNISLIKGTYYSIVIKPQYGSNIQIMVDRTETSYSDIHFICDFSNEYCFYKSGNNWIKQNEKDPRFTYRIKGIVMDFSLNKNVIEMKVGHKEQLIANKTGGLWSSSNPLVASVDNDGWITANQEGQSIITYTLNGNQLQCIVNISADKPITSVTLNKKEMTLEKTKTETLEATINPSDTTDSKTLTWKSSDQNVATVDANGKVTGVNTGTATITVTTSNNKTATCQVTVIKQTPTLSYQTHIEDYGWQASVTEGNVSGTTGKSKRLEGIKISLKNNESYTGDIEYRTHVQDYGWQNWVSNGEMSGTSGQSKRLEAIQIRLTGEMADNYDVYYRVHAQEFGWLDWAKNGESSGTAGYSYRLEAIEIMLVEKEGSAPGSTARPFHQKYYVGYKTHVQDYGWQSIVYDGSTSGTTERSKRLEGIQIKLENPLYEGNIEYRTHVQNIGWETSWKKNGSMSGTSGKSLRLEAIQIKLTGEMANQYNIYYRVHAQDYGWLGWASDGASAGTEGLSKRLEGIQIKLVKKGEAAPGSTDKAFIKK